VTETQKADRLLAAAQALCLINEPALAMVKLIAARILMKKVAVR
jgi:hypothetical protein